MNEIFNFFVAGEFGEEEIEAESGLGLPISRVALEILRNGPLNATHALERSHQRRPTSFSVESIMGRTLLALAQESFKEHVSHAKSYWKLRGFPYTRITHEDVRSELLRLERSDSGRGRDLDVDSLSTVGLRVANAFHPQMWHVREDARWGSPYDYFNNEVHLARVLERNPRFWPNRAAWNAQCVRSGFRIMAQGRVGNFRPVIARRIVRAFCRSNAVVLDFSAGYGGRLLGAISLPVRYIGIDPCELQVLGLRRMAEVLADEAAGRAEIIHGCAEDVMPAIPQNSVDLVFSSPPYFNHEVYSNEPTQSAFRFPVYRDWFDSFLCRVISESRRVLRRDGMLVLNVANLARFDLADDTERELRRVFGTVQVLRIPMGRVPSHRNEYAWLRSEPLFICSKK